MIIGHYHETLLKMTGLTKLAHFTNTKFKPVGAQNSNFELLLN